MASEIDLPWTYVAGSAGLIGALVDRRDVEAMRVEPGDSHHQRSSGWLADAIDVMLTDLLATGQARMTTTRGEVNARLSGSGRWWSRRVLETDAERPGAARSTRTSLFERDGESARRKIRSCLVHAVLGLVGS